VLDPVWSRELVLSSTVVRPAPYVPEVRLHLAEDVTLLWQRLERDLDRTGTEPPYWSSAWAGGQAVARYVLDNPEVVAGRRVLDLASGSGLCAIASALAGAGQVTASEVDEISVSAIEVNAAVNGVSISAVLRDFVAGEPPDVDVVLAGDVCYERRMAERILDWLSRCRRRGVEVVLGDPGRAFLPESGLLELGRYEIAGDPMLENAGVRHARAFTFV